MLKESNIRLKQDVKGDSRENRDNRNSGFLDTLIDKINDGYRRIKKALDEESVFADAILSCASVFGRDTGTGSKSKVRY